MSISRKVTLPICNPNFARNVMTSSTQMGHLAIHVLLFLLSILAAAFALAHYKTQPVDLKVSPALLNTFSYYPAFMIFVTHACINFSYFSYLLAVILNLLHVLHVFFIFRIIPEFKLIFEIQLLIANLLKSVYIVYLLIIHRNDEYRITFKRFGSNLILYCK